MLSGRLLDFVTQAKHTKRLWIRADCDGSPACVAELYTSENGRETELHLTYDECKRIRKALKRAMKAHKENE